MYFYLYINVCLALSFLIRLNNLMRKQVESKFGMEWAKVVPRDRLVYGDFISGKYYVVANSKVQMKSLGIMLLKARILVFTKRSRA